MNNQEPEINAPWREDFDETKPINDDLVLVDNQGPKESDHDFYSRRWKDLSIKTCCNPKKELYDRHRNSYVGFDLRHFKDYCGYPLSADGNWAGGHTVHSTPHPDFDLTEFQYFCCVYKMRYSM